MIGFADSYSAWTPSADCPTDYGLALKLAEFYLEETVKIDEKGMLSIGALQLPRLTARRRRI